MEKGVLDTNMMMLSRSIILSTLTTHEIRTVINVLGYRNPFFSWLVHIRPSEHPIYSSKKRFSTLKINLPSSIKPESYINQGIKAV